MQPAYTAGPLRPYPAGVPVSLSPATTSNKTDCLSAVYLAAGIPAAWLFHGSCITRTGRIDFYDVAYVRPTTSQYGTPTGSMLDSDSFGTEAEALQFVEALIRQIGGAA